MLAAAVRRSGCLARRHRVVRDDQHGLAAVHEAMPGAGMLVTSGGVSMGRRAGCRQGCPCRNEAQTPSARWPIGVHSVYQGQGVETPLSLAMTMLVIRKAQAYGTRGTNPGDCGNGYMPETAGCVAGANDYQAAHRTLNE